MPEVRWLRTSYWVGAIADAIAGVLMLFPKAGSYAYLVRQTCAEALDTKFMRSVDS